MQRARRRGLGHITPGRWTVAGIGLLVLLTTAAYLPSLDGKFLVDDDVLLTNSPLIAAPDGVSRFWFTAEAVDYWPVSNTSLWLEWRLWKMNATGYRLTNLVLHVIAALLLWSILQSLSVPGAFFAALLFALHPVNVQSVAWITQRKSLLAMVFALLCVLWHRRSEARSARHPAWLFSDAWYWLSVAAFALAVLSKISAAVVVPLLFAVVAWVRPLTRRDLARAVPFTLIALAVVAVNLWFRTHSGHIAPTTGSALERVLSAAGTIWFYLYTALLPIRLAYTYPVWQAHSDRLSSWLPMLAIVAVTLALWRYRRRGTRALLFGWSIYCVALLPAMGLTEKLVIADRYQHMALIALVALAAAGWDTWRRSAPGSRPVLPYAAAVLLIGAYAVLTWRQSAVYADSLTLMQAAVDSYPNSALAHHNVAFALLGAGRLREAREHLEYALRLEPDCVDAHNTLAATFSEAGHSREAIPHLEAVLRLAPDDPSALSNLGAALREAGKPAQAAAYLQRALQLKPDAASHRNLGKALLQLGRPAEAIEQFRHALQMDGDDTDARRQLDSALTAQQTSSRNPDGPGS